jgi:hypothetical protein
MLPENFCPSGFVIGVAGEDAAHGAFRREKPHFAKFGSGTEIVKALPGERSEMKAYLFSVTPTEEKLYLVIQIQRALSSRARR